MLTYELNARSSCSLYEQLYQAIRTDIEKGHLDAGSKLPSKRSLAQHLGVSVITVENAYRQLIAEGYIEAQERRGYFVNKLPTVQLREPPSQAALTHHESEPLSMSEHSSSASFPLIRATPLLADFSGNDRSGNQFPFHIWAKTVRRTLSEASKGVVLRTSYDNRGAAELREAIAQHLVRFRGLVVSPDQIIIGAGAQDLYGVLVQLLGRDRVFAVEDPGYPALRTHYQLNDAEVVDVPIDEKGLDVAALKASPASVAHCTPAHQFPTGSVMSAVRRHELLDWAHEITEPRNTEQPLRRYVIEDDYDSEFRMRGRPIPPLYMQDGHESVIYLNTFTRSLGNVFRIAYMVLPPHLLTVFNERFTARSCMVGALEQLELSRFIMSGDYERHINRQRSTYRRVQDTLVSLLSTSEIGNYLDFRGVGSGLHFLMDVDLERLVHDGKGCRLLPNAPGAKRNAILSTMLEEAALEQGIRLVNIDAYRSGTACLPAKERGPKSSPVMNALKSSTTPHCLAYVMNVSGLDDKRTDKIATALSHAILDLKSK